LRRPALAFLEEGDTDQTAKGRESHSDHGSDQPIDQSLTDGFGKRAVLVHPQQLVDLGSGVRILTTHIPDRLKNGQHGGLTNEEPKWNSDNEVYKRPDGAGEQPDYSTLA
jgi:hypothetical protein